MRENLDRDPPPERLLLGLVDDAHTPAPQLAQECENRPAARPPDRFTQGMPDERSVSLACSTSRIIENNSRMSLAKAGCCAAYASTEGSSPRRQRW